MRWFVEQQQIINSFFLPNKNKYIQDKSFMYFNNNFQKNTFLNNTSTPLAVHRD